MEKEVKQKPLHRRSMFLTGGGLGIGLVLAYIFIIGHQNFVEGKKPNLQELQDFYKKFNTKGSNFTYDQLRQWFEAQVPDVLQFEVYPRLFPFCVTYHQIKDPFRTRNGTHITKFARIFEDMERVNEAFYNFDADTHSAAKNKKWVKNIVFSRINTPELDMVNLRQWVHITVQAADNVKIKGLYMQSIVGPMGLPFGEFYLEFPCVDDVQSKDLADIGQKTYCSYRPRTSIQHPSAYVGYSEKGRTEYHMNFFYTDIPCMETPYLQFLMLVVTDFDGFNKTIGPRIGIDYQPQLSPLYLNEHFDSKSGAPFPYYPEWKDQMYCFLTSSTFQSTYQKLYPKFPTKKAGADGAYEAIAWKESTTTFRVLANELYDACLTGRLGERGKAHLRDEERFECPPGPFRCDPNITSAGRNKVTEARRALIKNEEKLKDCKPCGAPACSDIGYPEQLCDYKPNNQVQDKNISEELLKLQDVGPVKSHGVLAIFAFLVLVPLANFIARFYKDLSSGFFCGNGAWLCIHILSHILSLLFMWISIGPIIPKLFELESDFKRCQALLNGTTGSKQELLAKATQCVAKRQARAGHHGVPAMATFVIQHFLVAFGFWRVANPKLRQIQIALHSHFGYACWLLGAVSAIVATGFDKCGDLLSICIFFLATPFIFSAAGVALDCLTDKKVGILPPRKQWPVLETVKLEGKSPFTFPKWIIFGVYTACMVFFWVAALTSSMTIQGNAEQALEGKNADAINVQVMGLLGDCHE